ncbi:MAG: hypothetical protein ACTSRS_03185 [Candidatus Helarchaeota archaeon]
MDKEFCSVKCEQEYFEWKNKQKSKNRNMYICMIGMMITVIVIMFILPMVMP